jgi:hypothetical protein
MMAEKAEHCQCFFSDISCSTFVEIFCQIFSPDIHFQRYLAKSWFKILPYSAAAPIPRIVAHKNSPPH